MQNYFDYKANSEIGPLIDKDGTAFLKKKRLKDQIIIKEDDNMLLETNHFSNLITNNNINFQCLSTLDGSVYDKKNINESKYIDLSLEESK